MEKKRTYREYTKGLPLSRAYFEQIVYPMLKREYSSYLPRMAACFSGAGSEYYGYDDVMSQDRKFGVAYQLLIPGEDEQTYGKRLRERLSGLPQTFDGYQVLSDDRCGLMSIEAFYEKYLGYAEGPVTQEEWRTLDDCALSTATNGEVFFDNYGRFSAIRTRLLQGYPEEERRLRLAEACEKAGKSGQYNLGRCTSRRQWIAASIAAAEFMDSISQILFLLNRVYRPYFKWFPNAMKDLPVLGEELGRNMEYFSILSIKQDKGTAVALAENMCQLMIEELRKEGLTRSGSRLLAAHGRELKAKGNDKA